MSPGEQFFSSPTFFSSGCMRENEKNEREKAERDV